MIIALIVVGSLYAVGVLCSLGFWVRKAGADYVFDTDLFPTFLGIALLWPVAVAERIGG